MILHAKRDAVLRHLAEEACEVGQAALKLIRTRDPDDPTDMTEVEATAALREELIDLMMNVQVLDSKLALQLNGLASCSPKWERWEQRLKEPKHG